MAEDPQGAADAAAPIPVLEHVGEWDAVIAADGSGEPSRASRIAAVLRTWRDDSIANGPIARDVGAWNQLDAALDDLASALLKEI
jgi:hypothetical protein